jgi:hypothetical protein
MQLEDYFEFEKFDTPHGPIEPTCIKGHRIAIEHVIRRCIDGAPPEMLVRNSQHVGFRGV